MKQNEIQKITSALNIARTTGSSVEQFSDRYDNFKRSDAYTIQEGGIAFRINDGEIQVGMKMGLTSKAKREQMNLDAPLYGVLTDKMEVKNGGDLSMNGSIHPKIEPEVAFYITKDLSGKVTREEVLDATGWICSCMEILDSRYNHFKYFSMEDVIADNSSSFKYVLGEKIENFKDIDLTNLNMTMKVNGEVSKTGNTNSISGDPVVSIQQLCELLAERKQTLKAGQVVLAGAATVAVDLGPGMKIDLSVEALGDVSVNILA